MAHDTVRGSVVSTPRLTAGGWHDLAERRRLDLAHVVRTILTPVTTAALPPEWHGDYDLERAARWIDARDAESPTLLVVERQTQRPVGLLILFEDGDERDPGLVDVHLGYVLSESAWGRGLATELVAGFVEWARSESSIRSISGGVEPKNVASARVLRSNGFVRSEMRSGEDVYRLPLRRESP